MPVTGHGKWRIDGALGTGQIQAFDPLSLWNFWMLHTRWRRVSVAALPVLAGALLLGGRAEAQVGRATVAQEENLRAEPNGVVVAVLESGLALEFVRETGNWAEVAVEGWVWSESLQTRSGGSYDLTVAVEGGENLRSRPQGTILARLEQGTLLEELERRPGWIRVRRQAWIWKASIQVESGAGPVAGSEPDRGSAGSSAPPATASAFRAGSASPILASPDGDTLGLLRPGTELSVTGRQGNWARVRVEGWVWSPPGEAPEGEAGETAMNITLADVLAAPEEYVGRLVTWELQFVSLEAAEVVRTDFYEGEPFLLTRPAGQAATRFVYVAVPPEQLVAAEGLTPLERINVVGRIRTGASALTGAPILDLVEIRTGGELDG